MRGPGTWRERRVLTPDLTPHSSRLPRQFIHRPAPTISAGLVLFVILVLVGGGILLWSRKAITLDVDGQLATIYTFQSTVGALLDELGLSLGARDGLSPASSQPLNSGATVRVRRAQPVRVLVDGQTIALQARERGLTALLAEAEVTLAPGDRVRVDGAFVPDPAAWVGTRVPVLIEVWRALPVTLDDGGVRTTVQAAGPLVRDLLEAQGLTLFAADTITPPVDTPLRAGLVVAIDRSRPLTITVDGVTVRTRTQATTVGAALTGAGLALVGEDYSLPPLEAPLPEDGLIRVVRVSTTLDVARWLLPARTRYLPDARLPLDVQQVIVPGQAGVAEQRVSVRYEDGVEVARQAEPDQVVLPAQEALVAYGTQIAARALDTPGGRQDYWRAIPVWSVAGELVGVRFVDGLPVVEVDPALIPAGTRLVVPGFGLAVAGEGASGRQVILPAGLDVPARRRWVTVYLLAPAPPAAAIPYVLP